MSSESNRNPGRGGDPIEREEKGEAMPLGELENQREICIQRAWETYRLCASVATDRAGARAPRGMALFRRKSTAPSAPPPASEGTAGPSRVIAWLWDAAQVAHFTAEMLLRRSDFALVAASTCAEICDWVADELEARTDDEALLACSEMCRALAEECDRLADEPESLAA